MLEQDAAEFAVDVIGVNAGADQPAPGREFFDELQLGQRLAAARAGKLGVDIGLGFAYDINSHWAIGAEGKYQYVDDWDDAYLSFCASYKF